MDELTRMDFGYYARNEKERGFDDWVRQRVLDSGDRALMALYVQNQEILNLLRHVDDQTRKK